MELESAKALAALSTGDRRWPGKGDSRFRHGLVFPQFLPSFRFDRGDRVFTIGSCFARNIEEYLTDQVVPTLRFRVPPEEWPHRSNGLINEYNPGTMAQRIERAFGGPPETLDSIVPHQGDGFVDLMLPGTGAVSYDRAVERRAEIDAIYAFLPGSQAVVITLGLVEAWFDTACARYLNRMPPVSVLRKQPGRYVVRMLDVQQTYSLVAPAIDLLVKNGSPVILTVSPVPLGLSFFSEDAVVANAFSKSVLRVCARGLQQSFPGRVDYFPSYEIVMSGGVSSFIDDNIHVCEDVVRVVVEYMLSKYRANRPPES